MKGLTLDAGALIALERGDERVRALLQRAAVDPEAALHIPAGVLAQVLRDPRRQTRLARLLKHDHTNVVPLDDATARVVGLLLGLRRCSDAIDASVVVCARRHRQGVVTSDPDDLRRLDPRLPLTVL
ncbi:MAG: PIN domain-containing protein [Solirubrobacteraceae bacterium]